MKLKYSMLINIILLITLLFVIYKGGLYYSLLNKLKPKSLAENNFQNTWEYQHNTKLYKFYTKQANIVMLGNSITYRVDWNELLNRNDIANRGIGNDITLGMLNRLDDVYRVNPQVCVVMGGINDILKGIETETIVLNIDTIIKELKTNNIKPIICSILYTSDTQKDYKKLNSLINEVNINLESICLTNDISFINLNESFSDNYTLKSQYSLDGIHLTASGYNQWKKILEPILNQEIEE